MSSIYIPSVMVNSISIFSWASNGYCRLPSLYFQDRDRDSSRRSSRSSSRQRSATSRNQKKSKRDRGGDVIELSSSEEEEDVKIIDGNDDDEGMHFYVNNSGDPNTGQIQYSGCWNTEQIAEFFVFHGWQNGHHLFGFPIFQIIG